MSNAPSSQATAPQDDNNFRQDRNHSRLALPVRLLQELDDKEAADQLEREADSSWKLAQVRAEVKPDVPAVRPPQRCPKNSIRLYDPTVLEDLQARLNKGQEGRGDRADMLKKNCKFLLEKSPFRRLTKPPIGWEKKLIQLRLTYPNGAEVFNYLDAELRIAEHCGRPLSFAPFGLNGPPGVGKSVLVEGVADLLGTQLHRVQVEVSSHASALIGTEMHWSNSGPGLLFQTLTDGDEANPILMLDELEKVQTREDYPNIHKVLYGLLESASAKKFRDASFPILALDASHVRWIGTTNSLVGIPLAIRSRMRFFDIPELTLEQSQKILLTMDEKIRVELKVTDWPALGVEVLSRLSTESPRRMRLLLRAAYGNAMVRSDRNVLLTDLPPKDEAITATKTGDSTAGKQLENLLSITNFAAFRAIEMERRIAMAERLWSYVDSGPQQTH